MPADGDNRALFHRSGQLGRGDGDAFPNRKAFIATLNHGSYQDMHRHRDAGLLAQELITTRPSIPE